MLAPEAIITMVTALAASIAQGRDNDEIALIGTVFTQLGDTLTTLSVAKDIIKNKKGNNADNPAPTADTTKNTDKKEGENSDGQNPA